jgi:predicted site-specific integrase-resolvase
MVTNMDNTPDTPPVLISQAAAATLAGVHKNTIGRWADDGRLTRYTNAVGQVKFDQDEVKEKTKMIPEVR